jgi:2-succinyl-6-hydroxy-2,4-cyclohexadiene-1-carboxylate synthase
VIGAVVLLHGFGGTHRAWDEVLERLDRERYPPLVLDLPGHGEQANAPTPITFPGCVEHVLARAPERFLLAGYSLGGRIALHVALAAPERVAGLVLVATTAGIEDEHEREQRRLADRRLAERLEREPYEQFIAAWRSQPLFAADPPAVRDAAVADQRRNRPASLAAALRGIGTGEMQSLWGQLATLPMPTRVIAGERDEKFQAIGRRLAQEIPRGELLVVPGGHVLPRENPAAVAAAIEGCCSG